MPPDVQAWWPANADEWKEHAARVRTGAIADWYEQLRPAIAGGMLVARLVDVYWMIVPAMHHGAFVVHWLDVAAFLAIGGVSLLYTSYYPSVSQPSMVEALRATLSGFNESLASPKSRIFA